MIIVPAPRPGTRVLAAVASMLPRARLDPQELIARARRRTGLTDFGPEGPYEEALAVLCRALDGEAALTPLGRQLARQMLLEVFAQHYPGMGRLSGASWEDDLAGDRLKASADTPRSA